MAKAKYNPLSAFRDDPLAALKEATEHPRPKQENPESESSAGTVTQQVSEDAGTQKPEPQSSRPVETRSRASTKPLAATLNTSRNTVYLYPEDLTKLRQISGYISSEHGIRANDSMIFRAALSLVEQDARLLHALRETESLDRRRKGKSA